jgi:hypothetical protein
MIFEVLVCPCGAAPECPFDQSYDSALIVSLTLRKEHAKIVWLWLNDIDTIGVPNFGGRES